ncbi:hypothetical protein PENSUB_5857 [Penicillium subrubescens]|uniref:Uncharacterized protein n=1 Tax=Penicillium subrubescens TaxID=1316194 RepID=A0A1Q5UQP4_9EURO|nr:hypothetical protein PENSUB_5857 [Penicillium subrubescens]
MDAKQSFPGGYEQTLPVLTRPPASDSSTWAETDPNFDTDPYTMSMLSLPPTTPAPPPQTAAPASAPNATSQQPAQAQATATTTSTDRNAPTKIRKPRKAANASAGKSTLFWVHSDPDSAAGGTKEETLKRIRSHVMSEHNRKKRLENTKKYKGKSWKHLAFQPPETIPGGMGPPRPPVSTPSSSSSSSRLGSQVSESPPLKNELVPTTSAVEYYTPVPAETATWTEQTWSEDSWEDILWDLTQEAHPLQTRYKPKLQAHWAALIQRDPAILHAAICMSTSNAAMQRGELPIRDPNQHRSALVVDTFHHRGETIRLVNEGLSDPVKCSSDELIAAVSTLLTIEIASGNPDYLKIHLAGLRQMIGMRKNFADVPSDIRFQINWTDIRVACMALTKPIFPFVRSTRPPGLSLLPPNDDVGLCATRLLPLMKIPGIFSDTFSKIIYDLLELSWYAEWIKGSSGYQEFDSDTEDYFNFEVLYVEYSLHADRYTPTGQIKGDNSIEGCTRLACLCYHNSAIWTFYPMVAPLLPKPILALRAALEATIPSGLFSLCRDLLIWVLFIGAACSQVMPSERTYFVTELAAAVQLHGVTSWQECRSILLGFFHADRVHLVTLRQVWQEVQGRMDPAGV